MNHKRWRVVMLTCALFGCESESDRAEKNRQKLLADEAACKDELAHYDSWSNTPLSERCSRVAKRHEQQHEREVADNARKAEQALAQHSAELDAAAGKSCDAQARANREQWLDTKVTEAGYTSSPRDEGFGIDGACGQKLVQRSLDCSDNMIRTVDGDSPWLVDAQRAGFTRLVCNEVDHLTKDDGIVVKRSVEKPIEWLTTKAPK